MSKGTIVSALNFLSKELKKAKLCNDTKPIDNAVNDLNSRKDKAEYW